MNGALERIGSRLRALATRRPRARDLVDLSIAIIALAVLAAAFGGDLVAPASLSLGSLASMAAFALVVPALGEEIVFRGLLIPDAAQDRGGVVLASSTALFVLWHVFEVLTFLPGARALFLRADFLVLVAGLGLACGVLRMRSGGLCTAVMLHWLVVVVWKGFLGGPALADLAAGG